MIIDLDPVALSIGPLQIRWYGAMFALTLGVAFLFWRAQMRRGGYPTKIIDGFILWGALGTVLGARLGHCFFYHPQEYLADPIRVLFFWKGGLASHGATVGLFVVLLVYSWIHKLRPLEIFDRFACSAAVGAAGIRMGNFLNSEIVGRSSDVAWAMKFPRYDYTYNTAEWTKQLSLSAHDWLITHSNNGHLPPYEKLPVWVREELWALTATRHPSQLYEFSIGVMVLLALIFADRFAGKEKRPLGLLAGLFFTLYFAGRFCVEFFKARHVLGTDASMLSMGQYLSLIPFLAGIGLLIWVAKTRKTTCELPAWTLPEPPTKATTSQPINTKKRRRKKS